MPKVPVITSPCPLRFNGAPRPGQDFCGQCQRRVHNLDGMSDSERHAFFAACSGEVCVAYTVKRPMLIAGLATIGVAAGAALAQEVTVNNPPSPYCDPTSLNDIIITGGTNAAKQMEWVDESEVQAPDLPEIEASEWLPTPK